MEVDERRRLESSILEHPQRGFEHGALTFGPARLAERMAVAKGNEERPRRPYPQGDLAQELDRRR